jgi:hypothetical protein
MKENFDDILKRRWEERSFPVDDGHRTEMIELLSKQKRRRALPFWWFSGLAIVLMAGGFLWYTRMYAPPPESMKPAKDAKHSAASDKTEIASGTEERTIHGNELNKTSSPGLNKNEINYNPEVSGNHGNLFSSTTGNHSAINGHTSKSSNSQKNEGDTRSNNKIAKTKAPAEINSNAVSAPSDKIFLVDEEAAHSYKIVSTTVAVIVEPEPEWEYNPNVQKASVAAQRNSTFSPVVGPLAMEGIFYLHDDQMNTIEPKATRANSFYLFGELGSGLILASQPDFISGWKLRTGGGVGYSLEPKLQLILSAGYLMQHGGFDFQRISTVTIQGFGVRSNFNTLTAKTLHFVYSRLGAQYRMHRHIVAGHGGVQYLYGAYGNIVTQTQDQLVPDFEETSTNTWVRTDGLRKFLWSADIAYGYQMTPRLSLMIGTDINFSDITVEDPALTQDGYYWKGAYSTLHPFVTLNYLIHGHL